MSYDMSGSKGSAFKSFFALNLNAHHVYCSGVWPHSRSRYTHFQCYGAAASDFGIVNWMASRTGVFDGDPFVGRGFIGWRCSLTKFFLYGWPNPSKARYERKFSNQIYESKHWKRRGEKTS